MASMRRWIPATFILLASMASAVGCPSPRQESTISAPSDPPKATASVTGSVAVEHGACPAGKVTVDGAPMKAKSARAYGFADAGKKDAFVLVLSTAELSCAQLLSGSWPVTKDDVFLDVGTGPNDSAQQFVTSQNETAKVPTELVRRAEKAGAPVGICVRKKATLTTSMIKKSTIEVEGLVQGTYCGELK